MIRFSRNIELREDVDVIVIGGGPAGCAAAVTAARQGARVFLIDGMGFMGGAGTAALVPFFMSFDDGERMLSDGIGREILERLHAYHEPDGPEFECGIRQEDLKRVYDDMLTGAGVNFVNFTQLIGVQMDSGRIDHCILSAKSGLYAARAKIYIDATGDGDLSVMAGAPFELGDADGNMMAGTLCSLWTPVHWDKVSAQGNERLEAAFKDGVFEKLDMHLPGMFRISKRIGGGNIGHAFGVDGTDERSMTEAMVYSRRLLSQYETYYKKYLKGFEDMDLVATGASLGIRETRRIMGDYVLNIEDFIARANFEDEIGRYNYPVDIHASDTSVQSYYDQYHNNFKHYRYTKGESYGIPYRTLLPKGVDNLLVAGRCISTDRAMQASVRVIPGCYITGMAAGLAASMAAKENSTPRQVDVPTLREALREAGAYLP